MRSHAGCGRTSDQGVRVARPRVSRRNESGERCGSLDASIRSDPAGGGARRHSSASGRCSRDLTAHPGSQHPADGTRHTAAGPPDRRASREISRSIFMGLAIRNPYPNLIVECPFTCQRLVAGPRLPELTPPTYLCDLGPGDTCSFSALTESTPRGSLTWSSQGPGHKVCATRDRGQAVGQRALTVGFLVKAALHRASWPPGSRLSRQHPTQPRASPRVQ